MFRISSATRKAVLGTVALALDAFESLVCDVVRFGDERREMAEGVPAARGSDVQAAELPPVKPKRAPRRGGGGRRTPRPYTKPTELEQARAARTVEP